MNFAIATSSEEAFFSDLVENSVWMRDVEAQDRMHEEDRGDVFTTYVDGWKFVAIRSRRSQFSLAARNMFRASELRTCSLALAVRAIHLAVKQEKL